MSDVDSSAGDEAGGTTTLPQGWSETGLAIGEGLGEARGADEPRPRGSMIGRYVVLSPIGEGGMGVVVAAFDPDLDRKVALKQVRPQADAADVGAMRLLREAQALAKLSHPNVVAIHDVGVHDGQVWIAMELVAGRTLGAWAAGRSRRWPELLDVLTQVARGVAAAHAAGLVHRDLKPENVMIDDGGRVRVMDFGLAHGRVDLETISIEDEPAPTGELALAATAATHTAALVALLTQSGTVQGTPAYMAPEQWRGQTAEPATDQFGWSVMAWELLYGERPFGGDSLPALRASVLAGKPRPPADRQVPRWLRRVIERGLSTDADRRWPTMAALVAALERGRTRARLRLSALVLASVAGLAAIVLGVRRWEVARTVAACTAEGESIAEVWNEQARVKLRAGLLATGVSYAESTADRVAPYLEAQAAAWTQARTEVCLAARVRGTMDEETLGRAVWCLGERRLQLDATIAGFSQAGAGAVPLAVDAAAGLSRIAACLDTRRLALSPPPPEHREAVREFKALLSRANALSVAGEYAEGLVVAREALAAAEQLDAPALVAEARAFAAGLLMETGDNPGAEAAFEAAFFQAAGVGALEVAAGIAVDLAWNVGHQQERHRDGLRWSKHADVAITQLGAGDETGLRAKALNNLAGIHMSLGEYAEGRALLARALAIYEQVLVPDHPQIASSLNNLAQASAYLGDYAEALGLHTRALAIQERVLGPDHPMVALSLNNLGFVESYTGEHEAARAHQLRALAIRERVFGPEHQEVALSLNNLGIVHLATGDVDAAKVCYSRALTIYEKALGPEHPATAGALHNLGSAHADAGEYDQARTLCERALALYEKALGPDHPNVAAPLTRLAKVALAQARAADAVALAGRAVQVREATGAPAEKLADSRFALARALWAAAIEGGPERAHEQARLAGDLYRGARGKAKELAEVEAFLASH